MTGIAFHGELRRPAQRPPAPQGRTHDRSPAHRDRASWLVLKAGSWLLIVSGHDTIEVVCIDQLRATGSLTTFTSPDPDLALLEAAHGVVLPGSGEGPSHVRRGSASSPSRRACRPVGPLWSCHRATARAMSRRDAVAGAEVADARGLAAFSTSMTCDRNRNRCRVVNGAHGTSRTARYRRTDPTSDGRGRCPASPCRRAAAPARRS